MIELRDGSQVEVRQLGPDDKEGLAEGVARLSPESRYRRFLSPTPRLSAKQLAYFTEIDHSDHEGLVAIDPATRHGVGVARFVRSPDNPNEAEYAIAVADDWQGRGLGTALLHALEQRAREEGIEWFTGLVLADNRQMLDVLAGLGGFEQRRADYGTVEVRLHIPEASQEQEPERISGWMRAAASGDLTSRLGD